MGLPGGEDPFLKVVYFTEGTDLSWYKHFTGLPYEITISAIKDEDGHYREAEIVEDEVRNATNEERLERFNFYDQTSLAIAFPGTEEPLSQEDIQAVFTDATFSMYDGGDNEEQLITFRADGTVDATYVLASGEQQSLYEFWRIEEGNVICTHSFTFGYSENTIESKLTPFQLDETRYLMINKSRDDCFILTKQ